MKEPVARHALTRATYVRISADRFTWRGERSHDGKAWEQFLVIELHREAYSLTHDWSRSPARRAWSIRQLDDASAAEALHMETATHRLDHSCHPRISRTRGALNRIAE